MSHNQPFTDSSRTQGALYPDSQYGLVARFYPVLERCVFGFHLENARQAFFESVVGSESILLVGEGNGRFLKSLLARKTAGCICVVDKSPVMIRLAKERIAVRGTTDLKLVEADIRCYAPEHTFDCIVTHFFIDQFNPPAQQAIIERFTKWTADNAVWVNVDFIPPRTLRGRALMWLQYAFFRIMTRIEARCCRDESTLAAQNGWSVFENLSFLSGFVVAKRYKKRRKCSACYGIS
jgi:ubiquinone/menaquinone biosynthesis C-methylase UbiE